MDIYGSLLLGTSSTSTFTFQQSINLLVYNGGKLQDQTSGGQIYIRTNSVLRVYPGGSCGGSANTQIVSFTSLPATSSSGVSLTLGASQSGPFTCGVITSGSIVSFQKVTYIASQSGDFLTTTTWLGGIIPTFDVCFLVGNCGMYIASGCALSTASLNNQLTINFNVITVASGATIQLGTSGVSGGFTFNFAVAITIQSGGSCQDQTSSHQIYFPINSVSTFYSGAIFVGVNTVIQTYTSLPATGSLGVSYTIGSSISGALTIAILSTTSPILIFPKVTFIATVSGSIISGSTYLGGIAPTTDINTAVGGCGLYIASGCTLTTVGISNQLTININVITVASGGQCALGTSDVNTGFTFNFPISFIVQTGGLIQDQTPLHQIYCPHGSAFTFYSGQAFIGANTYIYTYTTLPATASLGTSYIFGSSVSGPFTFGILLDGTTQQFNQITFIAATSGSILSAGTYLNGIAPTISICSGGCGLYVASGCTLTTGDLGGTLNINFNVITIIFGAIFQLNTVVVSGFTFTYALVINNYGILQDMGGNNGGIFVAAGSSINIFAGGSFTSVVSATLYVISFTSQFFLGTLIDGPYFIFISLTGVISFNTECK